MSQLARARRAKQAASPELPFPEIQLELFPGIQLGRKPKPETPKKRFDYFGHFIAVLTNENGKPKQT